MNFNNLENLVGRLADQNNNQTSILGNGISDLGCGVVRYPNGFTWDAGANPFCKTTTTTPTTGA